MSAGTTSHTIRIEDDLWDRAQAKAASEGTTVSERVRAGLREYVYGPEARHTIADSLVYLVPGGLEALRGPASGTVQLPVHLDWGPDNVYDVADDGSCAVLYQLTLQNSGSVDEMAGIINVGRLLALWPSMRLPDPCRHLWETAFPQLPQHHESGEHPSWTTLSAQQPG
ncbi:ribbon-helix-helix domain-containing protein [Arthrobacter sp. NPDC056727]|uniref:ribbon-helix-helix domain-containing protein n=1 Tax=Arthrobacter sp. NPDC056727 TaxID=3345927 RepID=UPI003673267A